MGAVYLQNGVCLLPKINDHARRLKMLHNDVSEMGGEWEKSARWIFSGATLAVEAEQRLRTCEALLETYAQRVFEVHDGNH
jgi:hypothetical protein